MAIEKGIDKTAVSIGKIEKPDSKEWEELVSEGMDLRQSKDSVQWELGDLALRVEKKYGSNSIDKFSIEISINKKTLETYRTCSGFYAKKTRKEFERLGHSFFQTAMRKQTPNEAIKWLTKADEENLSIEGLRLVMSTKHSEKKENQIDSYFEKAESNLRKVAKYFPEKYTLDKMDSVGEVISTLKKEIKEAMKK